MDVQEKVEVWPDVVIVVGLKEAVQVGAAHTVTAAVQVFVVPVLFFTVRVQVCVAVGERLREPLAGENVPLPRLAVQLY